MKKFFLLTLVSFLIFSGCAGLITAPFKKTVSINSGSFGFEKLEGSVVVKRNNLGIPLIQAENINDLAYACGYVDALDRLYQMVGMKLVSQGRLSEMAGDSMLNFDIFIRSLNFEKRGKSLLKGADQELIKALESYSQGINEYIKRHGDKLSPGFKLAKYTPEKWTPLDSATVFILLNFGLSLNFHEEISALQFLNKVDADKIPYLFPVYPDEDLPFVEGEKFKNLPVKMHDDVINSLIKTQALLKNFATTPTAASNNWVIAPELTKNKKSIFANDTHLPLSLPSVWNMKHLRCPGFDSAGVGVGGFPAVVAGFNGNISWGMTMVMADNQDIFVEKIKNIDGKLHYLYMGEWVKTIERKEVFKTSGNREYTTTIHETIHGPIINNTFKNKRVHELQPISGRVGYTVSISMPYIEKDDTLTQFYRLNRAKTAKEAMEYIKEIKTISLNLVAADKENIGWQVTGLYPLRKKGRGFFPSPGWTGEFGWNGYLSNEDYPSSFNPEKGYIITANHRIIPKDSKLNLSSSWYYPDRFKRIRAMINKAGENDFQGMKRMHMDVKTYLPLKLRKKGIFTPFSSKLSIIISNMEVSDREEAEEIFDILASFDGEMKKDSMPAAVFGAFLHCVSKRIFLDELGPEKSPEWQVFCENEYYNYSPLYDHLLVREESPFYDDINTERKETKYEVIAYSLADTNRFLKSRLGNDRTKWQWGDLHKYYFETDSSKLSKSMGFFKKLGMSMLSKYFNRGPYPAPGDIGTINVAAHSPSKDFNVWIVPGMRIIADFSLEEPFYGVNSTGQSEHPDSPHYDDGIRAWLNGEYLSFPFKNENIEKTYKKSFVMEP